MEPGRPDDVARPIELGQDDCPTQPRLGGGIDLQVHDPELQEVVEVTRGSPSGTTAPISAEAAFDVAGEQQSHEPASTSERPARTGASESEGRPSGAMVAFRVIRVPVPAAASTGNLIHS